MANLQIWRQLDAILTQCQHFFVQFGLTSLRRSQLILDAAKFVLEICNVLLISKNKKKIQVIEHNIANVNINHVFN